MTVDDAARVRASRLDAANERYQGWRPPTVAEVVEHARRQDPSTINRRVGTIQLVIERDGEYAGDFGVTTMHPIPTVSLGITVAPGLHGQGIGGRACRMLIDALFADGTYRVVARVDPRNEPSLRLFDRLGFRREGHERASYYDPDYDEWTDEILFAVLASEWDGPLSRPCRA